MHSIIFTLISRPFVTGSDDDEIFDEDVTFVKIVENLSSWIRQLEVECGLLFLLLYFAAVITITRKINQIKSAIF